MTNMKTTGSTTGATDTAASSAPLPTFQQNLIEAFTPVLGEAETQQLASLISSLPTISGQTESQSIALYVDTLENLKAKNNAFAGISLTDTASVWIKSLQSANSDGELTAAEFNVQTNQALSSQFQAWLSKLLTENVDSSLSTEFVSQFNLGTQSNQAEQIANLSETELANATKEISLFVAELANQMGSREVRDASISFLRNAFSSLGSVNLAQLKSSDFLLTKESFALQVSAQLKSSFQGIGITLSTDDASALANRITWTPGISKQQLKEALDEMAAQVKGQYSAAYGEASGTNNLKAALNTVIGGTEPLTLSSLFANFAVSLTNIEIDDFYQDSAIADVQKTQITAAQVNLIKENTERDIRLQFEKIVKGESTGASFTERYETLRKNLGALKERLLNITDKEKADHEVRAEHSLTARDLLAVVESSIGDRFDEQVLLALNERRVNRLEKRNQQKEELQSFTARLKIFGEVQSLVHSKQSGGGTYGESYNPKDYTFDYSSFNYSSREEFYKSPELKHLAEVFRSDKGWGYPGPGKTLRLNNSYIDFDAIRRDNVDTDSVYKSADTYGVEFVFTKENIEKYIKPEYQALDGGVNPAPEDVRVTHLMFLKYEGVDVKDQSYQDGEKVKKLSNFSSSVSDKSKLLNDEVQIKTTELNDTSSQYNSTVEAMNKFVQKYHSILQEILRAI
ncbi:Type III secretion cytoplasmic LcrG inhibitor [Vibrio diabolicus]|uniref:Type III secretion cytoplasmic LcrG inhibitor n=2 Tax=Vibrio diabolicus TaxID=50719 RepID=A0AA92LV62_9VIBR|nr:Type III secretion cytoplasmic LcrG inhibitor [Vibrio diabolicus]